MRSLESGGTKTRNAIAIAAAAILLRRSRTSALFRMRLHQSSTFNPPLFPLHSHHSLLRPLLLPSFRSPCLLESSVAPRLVVSSSLSSVVTVAKAAGAAAGSHAAVSSAIAHVAVTAVAIASGACLSTRVDFLWPKGKDVPDSLVIDGVDVTGYPIFRDAKVQKAINFARKAHHGQRRKTGDAYVTHCIHTGKILAAMVPSSGCRPVNTVVAGILHDVIDDTFETLFIVEKEFGDDVAHLVAGVSKLSYTNQLLRRHRRNIVNQSALHPEEAKNLRGMLLGMVDDPRVVLIKLADRLHNMRTIHALSLPKAHAVAEETLAVWCSLASRLGVWALKAELEDLCFAVLQPGIFREMRAELASMWGSKDNSRNLGITNEISGSLEQLNQESVVISNHGSSLGNSDRTSYSKDLLQAVLPFDLLLDRRKRTMFLESLKQSNAPGIVGDAGIALASLVACEEALEREIFISTSYIPGMEVTIYSRMKSLYSMYCKMKRKGVSIKHVYDARALRVVVGDKNGTLHGPAVKNCYSLLNIAHRLWSPIGGEFDDYIINPKQSGYQSLHTAVQGPDNHSLEIQIRTQQMHEYAEFGLAAHWLYKEAGNTSGHESSTRYSSTYQAKHVENERVQDVFQKYRSLKVGHPVLRVEGSQLLSAVIVSIDIGCRELLVAVCFELEASEALTDRRHSIHSSPWEAHARLYKKVSDQWWCAPGHGDWSTCLEKYTLCRGGMYHKQDQFGRLLPTFIQVIELSDTEEAEYWMVVSAVFEGKQPAALSTPSSYSVKQNVPQLTPFTGDPGLNNKVRLLRTMLQWEEEVTHGVPINEMNQELSTCNPTLNEVVIICWPHGEIMRLGSGSTAADAARRIGMDGKLVLVNGQLTLPETLLKDGDILEVKL